MKNFIKSIVLPAILGGAVVLFGLWVISLAGNFHGF